MGRTGLGIGLLGCGVVGSAVARALTAHADLIARRTGRRLAIRAIAIRHPHKPRHVPVPASRFTDDPWEVVARSDVEIVVEVMGGHHPAGALIETALATGKPVVTANKELLGERLSELRGVAELTGTPLGFEAAVMAGVPVLDLVRRSLAGDRVDKLEGILNGTTNYCLHRLEEGSSLDEALQEAGELGLTELDPSADLEGRDSAAKLAILATLAFGRPVRTRDVLVTGISAVRPSDVIEARAQGNVLRLVAQAWRSDGRVAARVGPRSLPGSQPLAGVAGHHNGLVIEAALAGRLVVQGPGAGGAATAGAILGDLVSAAGAVVQHPPVERAVIGR